VVEDLLTDLAIEDVNSHRQPDIAVEMKEADWKFSRAAAPQRQFRAKANVLDGIKGQCADDVGCGRRGFDVGRLRQGLRVCAQLIEAESLRGP